MVTTTGAVTAPFGFGCRDEWRLAPEHRAMDTHARKEVITPMRNGDLNKQTDLMAECIYLKLDALLAKL